MCIVAEFPFRVSHEIILQTDFPSIKKNLEVIISQLAFGCSKTAIETLEQFVHTWFWCFRC